MFSGDEGLRYANKMFIDAFVDGEIYVLNHLTSERGSRMNGRRCMVVGRDRVAPADTNSNAAHINRRIQVRLLNPDTLKPEEGSALRICPKKLVDPSHYSDTASRSIIPKDKLLGWLGRTMDHAVAEGYHVPAPRGEFRDRERRCAYLRSLSRSGNKNEHVPSKCMDYMVPAEDQEDFELLRNACIPACAGDGSVHFARFGEGLVGTGSDCAICTEPIFTDVLRLPCNHMFHLGCAKTWLEDHEENCPTCRKDLPNPWRTYVLNADEQIQRRMEEWLLTGMCERCQAIYIENDPIVTVPDSGPNGESALMPLSHARRLGRHDGVESVQGLSKDKVYISA
mmetsp:Transcript_40049/g.78251  ORF Transcript_40049/g.78251 Transcript_40049/m.78251 type:complete len:339 (-) Transcript_40049:104-1120(-)